MNDLSEEAQHLVEGLEFAKEMDRVIGHISDAMEQKSELRTESMHMLVPCFISMAAQMSLRLAITKDQWLELAEITYREHSKINESTSTH
ncbi:MAG: hypothetical protein CL438_10155 [Acidimicrobiaceae bacterium]|nr:hypothetical protein [Acidimicrobiaceae bacterium]|tara:strand:+ start:13169 stop:13438 length:270 start_codon:yes stop_codon:yes gene_type:complete